MSHYTGTWAAFSCKNGQSCWKWLCFSGFFLSFSFIIFAKRNVYFNRFLSYSKWLGLPFSKETYWLVLLSTVEGLYTVVEICPINDYLTVFLFRCITGIFAVSQQNPLLVTTVPSLIWFWCTTCHGVLSFFTVENLLWWNQLKVLSLGGFPGKTFWLLAIFHLEMFAGWIQLVSLETCL